MVSVCGNPACKKQFEGRKNQVYCSPACKIKVNNEKASVKRKSQKPVEKALKSNYNILSKFHVDSKRDLVNLRTLTVVGFNPNVFTGINRKAGRSDYLE